MAKLYEKVDLTDVDVVGRNADGTGNNINDPLWGSTNTTFRRVTATSYLPDGNGDLTELDGTLPQVKTVSDTIFDLLPDDQDHPIAQGHNEYLVFFGQVLAHDLVFTNGGNPPVPFPDPTFPFGVRNGFVVENGVAQQSNNKTSFMDLSMVYGPNQAMTDLLTDGKRMILGPDNFLPSANEIDNSGGLLAGPFFAGDQRANQTPQLLSQQLIWARNHNWHVDELETKYGGIWSDEKIFDTARALNEAEWQNVVLNEYFKTLFGDKLANYTGYKPYVDPSIINEYTAVANRFGHDQSSNVHTALGEDGTVVDTKTLGEAFGLGFAGAANTPAILEEWMRGQLAQVSQATDGKVVDGNRELLFGFPLDLESVDIGRGRDHGVGNYNILRDGLGLSTFASIDAFAYANKLSASDTAKLKTLYGDDVNKMDALVGALLEKDAKGSTLGETITKLHVMQFEALRDGDRFYFENRFQGNADLIKSIKETSLSDIIARNTDIDYIYHDAFAAHNRIGGTAGNDYKNGTYGKDLLLGFGYNDTLKAKGGDDDVYGGDGKDKVYGDGGSDRVYGEYGTDYCYGGDGNDYVGGGYGSDYLWGNGGKDTFEFVGGGNDRIKDFARNEKIDLSEYADFQRYADVKAVAHNSGGNVVIGLDDGKIIIEHMSLSKLGAGNFIYSDILEYA